MKLAFNAETLAKSIGGGNGNEIDFEEYFEIHKSESGNPADPKFEYFKKKVLDHLAELEKKENHSVAKAIDITEWIHKANFPVGTVRTWNGQKFKKITPKKWARVYESESRGAKLAVAALRRKAAACKSSEELLQLCLENKERFVDANGKPLAFMQEFSAYVSSLNDKNEGGKTASGQTENKEKANNSDSISKIKAAFEGKSKEELEQNIKNLQRNARADDSMTVSLAGSEKMPIKDAIKILKDIQKTKTSGKTIDEKLNRLKERRSDPALTENDNNPQSDNGKTSGIDAIRSKYQSSKSIDGDEDEIYIGKETISGKWKLVEADAPSASHDEVTFHKTKGFPTAKDGGTVNDRDYEHDTAAQEAVLDMSADFDGRALGFDSPIVVTQDGVVTSGNNRTMSSKLAARKGTDTKYIEALKKRAKKFGFTADDVAQFKHPRVVFETEHKGDYTTDEFAKYNESGKKAKSPIEKAVEVSKRMKPETVESIADSIGEFDTMGELYADKKATQDIFNTLIQSNIIQKTDLSQYYTEGGITETGKEFLETVLIGSVVNETNIRALNGAKSLRQKLVRAIVPLVENKGMKGYSINKELNEAVGIAIQVAGEKSKKEPAFRSVEEFSQLPDMFEKQDPVAVELAKKLDGRTQKEFAEFMLEMNGGLRPAANGEVDIFLGECESKEDIVNRILKISKTVQKALARFFSHFGKAE